MNFNFLTEKEANQFYFYVLNTEFNGKVFLKGHSVQLRDFHVLKKTSLIDLIYPYILESYVPKISEKILMDTYYYQRDEVEQIIPFITSICETTKLLHSRLRFSLYERLIYFLYGYMQRSEVDMGRLYAELFEHEESWKEIVGYGIEEWLYELHFQEKMHELRQYLKNEPPAIDSVTVYLDGSAVFYDRNGQIIEPTHFNNQFRFNVLDHEYPEVLSSLLSIAPEEVNLYTANEQMHLVYFLLNVFQEKVKLFPIEQFPYKIKE
ncbi:sporulation protein YtxC [Halalkalibacillus sediminis]|nr:sporulation protein YtxC [Halalkalibacillus sediminis]